MALQSSNSASDVGQISTSDAISRPRLFLETKLMPDLEKTTALLQFLEQKRDNYLRLQEAVQTMNTSSKEVQEVDLDPIKPSNTISALANLGEGIHLPVDLQSNPLMIVSMGLGTTESSQGWDTDSGLYLQLTASEADQFAKKKVTIIARRIQMTREKLALIQGHAEMITQSIAQLEQLQSEPSTSLIDYLQT